MGKASKDKRVFISLLSLHFLFLVVWLISRRPCTSSMCFRIFITGKRKRMGGVRGVLSSFSKLMSNSTSLKVTESHLFLPYASSSYVSGSIHELCCFVCLRIYDSGSWFRLCWMQSKFFFARNCMSRNCRAKFASTPKKKKVKVCSVACEALAWGYHVKSQKKIGTSILILYNVIMFLEFSG